MQVYYKQKEFVYNRVVVFNAGVYRRQSWDGGVPSAARCGRQPGGQRRVDAASRHGLLRVSQYCQVSTYLVFGIK